MQTSDRREELIHRDTLDARMHCATPLMGPNCLRPWKHHIKHSSGCVRSACVQKMHTVSSEMLRCMMLPRSRCRDWAWYLRYFPWVWPSVCASHEGAGPGMVDGGLVRRQVHRAITRLVYGSGGALLCMSACHLGGRAFLWGRATAICWSLGVFATMCNNWRV